MGCWNGTCMVSNLPIIHGERIKLVFLHSMYSNNTNMLGKSGFCNINDLLTPAFLPISGEYNDYGNIENIDIDWNYKIIEDYLKKQLGDKILVDGKEKTNWDLTDVIKGIERGSFSYFKESDKDKLQRSLAATYEDRYEKKGETVPSDILDILNNNTPDKKRKLNLSFVMIREDIWNHIVKNFEGDLYDFSENNVGYTTADKLLKNEYDATVNNLKELQTIKDDKTLSDEEISINMLKFEMKNSYNIFKPQYSSDSKYLSKEEYSKYLINNIDNTDIYKQWMEISKIHIYLNEIRKAWLIQAGAGSQDANWNSYKLLSDFVSKLCDDKENEEDD